MRPVLILEATFAAHRRLADALATLRDDDVRRASLMPGWSRAHILTHLANKTRDHIGMIEGAVHNEVRRPDYEGAPSLVEIGAGRSADDLCSDVLTAFADLEGAWDGLAEDCWDRTGIAVPGPRPISDLAGRHLRDVEVHHADLDIGYGPADWSDTFIAYELPKRLAGLAGRTTHASLLAWLMGRGASPELGPW